MTFRIDVYKVKGARGAECRPPAPELFPGPFGPESREIRFVG